MSEMFMDTQNPVMVTGATGYVAGWLVKRLLEEGMTVHAAVRNPADHKKIQYLQEMAVSLPGHIRFFKANLLEDGSYEEAMQECTLVFHTASPFMLEVNDPQRDLVEPAQQGTRNLLDTVNRTTSVQRVVLTSSCAAMYGDNADLTALPNQSLTEDSWNTTSSLDYGPYSYSKTLAERAAWEIVEKQSRWRLVVVNPSLVIGPGINPHATSESFKIVEQLGNGRMKAGIPDIGMGVVDVRDLAEAHCHAGFLPNAEGRHIISGHNTSFYDLALSLLPRFDAYPIPRRRIPKWMVWLFAPWIDQRITRRYVSRNVGLPWVADNRKSIQALQMNYRPMAVSIQDMFQQMIDHGLIPNRG